VKISGEFNGGQGVQIRKEIPFSEVRFRIPRRRLIRQTILSALLMMIPIGALFLDIDRPLKWFALGFSAFFIILVNLMSGVFTEDELEQVDPVNHYGRGTLYFLGAFWLVLIAAIAWILFAKFPRP
jgi:hypothetical protein